ncbi:PaaI family thioesterase [Thalassobius aquimarinus]|uniref:PaaI family thioesterase n=1 Tax=Thalassovita aquimarina TaxID=2785917 RepID=A0ABS5HVN2_9RHOB|nr:PaaI family thioesterase [Thalassovita aquimarina]
MNVRDSHIDPALAEDPYALQKHLGFKITGWEKDYARVELPMQDHLGNRYGIPHGGVHATLLDTAMGFAGCYTGDPAEKQLAMTLSLNVNYVGQMKGSLLICEGFRTGGGRKTFFAEARVTDDLGTLIATGTAVFRYRSR